MQGHNSTFSFSWFSFQNCGIVLKFLGQVFLFHYSLFCSKRSCGLPWSTVVSHGLPWPPVVSMYTHSPVHGRPRETTVLRLSDLGLIAYPLPCPPVQGRPRETTGDTSPWASRFEFGNEPTRSRDTAIDMGDRGGPHIPCVTIFGVWNSTHLRAGDCGGPQSLFGVGNAFARP